MGVYIKNGSGDIKKLAGYVTVRQNTRWFLCTRTIEDNVEYYTVPKEAETYFKSINAYTIYSLGFNESNTTNTPKLRYGTTVLDIKDFSNQAGEVMVGQLNGVFQMFTQDLATDPKIYFVANTHKDEYDTEMSDTSTNAVQNKVIKAYADNIGTLAEAIRDNTTQIKPTSGGLAIGGANKPSRTENIAIGENATASDTRCIAIGSYAQSIRPYGIAIGYNARANGQCTLAISSSYEGAKASANDSIQLMDGTNTIPNSLQIAADNIYKTDTHTLTVKNAQVNGNNVYGVLQGETDPTGATVGAVGQFYLNTASKALWQCVATTTTTDATTYTWQTVGGSSEKKYLHIINFWVTSPYNFGGGNYHLEIISSIKDPIGANASDLAKFLYDNNYRSAWIDSSKPNSKGPCIVSNRFAAVSTDEGSALARTIGLYSQYHTTYETYILYATTDLIQGNKATIKINNNSYDMLQSLYDSGSTGVNITSQLRDNISDTVVEL